MFYKVFAVLIVFVLSWVGYSGIAQYLSGDAASPSVFGLLILLMASVAGVTVFDALWRNPE